MARRLNEYYFSQQADLREERRHLEEELAKLAEKNENLLEAIEAGQYNSIIARRLEENAQAAETYRRRLAELRLATSARFVTEDTLRAYLLVYARELDKKNTDDLKEVIGIFVDQVIIYREHIAVALKIDPTQMGWDTIGSGGGLLIVSQHTV